MANKQVLERARELFPDRKSRKTGAGNYTARELLTACKSLKGRPLEVSE